MWRDEYGRVWGDPPPVNTRSTVTANVEEARKREILLAYDHAIHETSALLRATEQQPGSNASSAYRLVQKTVERYKKDRERLIIDAVLESHVRFKRRRELPGFRLPKPTPYKKFTEIDDLCLEIHTKLQTTLRNIQDRY